MKEKFIVVSTLVIVLGMVLLTACSSTQKELTDLKLWYNKPAQVWEEALPIGNGRIGAMIFGEPVNECIQLNENTLWSGFPEDANNPKGAKALPAIRKAINNGDYVGAGELWKANSQGPYSARYMPMSDLRINMHDLGSIENFYRDLNISNAQSTVTFKSNGVTYKRTSFVSYPDQVLVVRIEADKDGALSFDALLNSKLRYSVSTNENKEFILKGKAPKYVAHRPYDPNQVVYEEEGGEGMTFETHLKIENEGGTLLANDSSLYIQNANAATLIISAATSYNGISKSPGLEGLDPSIEAIAKLKAVSGKTYAELLQRHETDYKSLFNNLELRLGAKNDIKEALPTNERLAAFEQDDSDGGMIALYYQFGRYLTIASSRKGTMPSNLQGMWNPSVQPRWGSNYTMNINTEMNYWPSELTGLQECHYPLFDFIESLSINGAKTARINYGAKRGWVAHHNSDVWAKSTPTGGFDKDAGSYPSWSCWPMSSAWLPQHLWEHYTFGGDKVFLKEKAYPLMKGAAEFALEWLYDDGSSYLVTSPASSPENIFKYKDKNGKEQLGEIAKASTMDMSMIWDLFTNCIAASKVLDTDADFRKEMEDAKSKLFPPHLGAEGQLQEWAEDFEDQDPEHRHVSHLFGLHPGKQINPRMSPDLAAAAKRTLQIRGDGGTGWAMAWKINFWARLEDGDHALLMLKNGLSFVDATDPTNQKGGTYANLLGAHPPFQIDGNFGSTSGITEMLVQSHGDEIFLLPALPTSWADGSVKGIRTRGGFVVDMEWRNGEIVEATIHSTLGGNCRVQTRQIIKSKDAELRDAEGKNPNPLFLGISAPLLAKGKNENKLQSLNLQDVCTVDFDTDSNKSYKLTRY